MEKRCLRVGVLSIILTAVLLSFLCAPAVAELSRGSKGDDVKALQSMLIDLGFLEDKADGIFGRNTQTAVKALQHYWGVEETGIADEGVVNDLEILWALAMGLERESGAPVDSEGYPSSCSWTQEGDEVYAQFCDRHIEQYPITVQLAYQNPPRKLEYLLMENACAFWLDSIRTMYAYWADRLDGADASVASEQYEIFRAALEENTEMWNKASASGSNEALHSRMKWLEILGVDLCFDLYGAEPNR
ncbi:MAG: peptidoglycan-binding protein [Clostridia bacterium]|nr:peptidoglycan-binding protein [Clostridia bacterium]